MWLNPLVIGLYLAAMFAIAFHFRRGQTEVKKFYLGNSTLPAWAIGMSLMATIISSVTFLAYPGQGFSGTWILLVQGLMVPPVLLCMIWFIVPVYRRFIGISTYEYFERRFGYGARLYSSLAFLIAHFSKVGFVVFLMATAIKQMVGLGQYETILLVGAVATGATLLGGLEAVVWTEVLQGFILIGAGILCAIVLLWKPTGHPIDVIRLASAAHKMSLGPFELTVAKETFWVLVLNGIFYAIQKYATDQTVVQRFLAARSDRDAIKASLLGAGLCVPVWVLFIFIGTGLWAFYRLTGEPLPAMNPEAVFPYFIETQLPPGVVGFVIAALISSALASLQSDLNCLSAVCVEDYYRRLRPAADAHHRLRVGKIIVVAAGIGAVVVASLYARFGQRNVLANIFDIYAIFSGGIAGLFVLAFFTTRANRRGVWIGIAACVLFTAWTFLANPSHLYLNLGKWNFTQPQLMVGVYSHLVLFGVGYFASLFFPAEKEVRKLTLYAWL
ncbi:MAG: sodium:solute symporter [Tepidisphaeraceae bacterium]|jgi:SSS family solute:Na+ symporter